MATLKIGGKDYDINPGWGMIENVSKRAAKKGLQNIDYLIEAIWSYLPRWPFKSFGFKPFLTRGRLRNIILPTELKKADIIVGNLVSVEDKEGGN